MLAKAKNDHANIKTTFLMNFLPEKKYGLPSWNFVTQNVLCEKSEEILNLGTFKTCFENAKSIEKSQNFPNLASGFLSSEQTR